MHLTSELENTAVKGKVHRASVTAGDLNRPLSNLQNHNQKICRTWKNWVRPTTNWIYLAPKLHPKTAEQAFKCTWNSHQQRPYPGPQNKMKKNLP